MNNITSFPSLDIHDGAEAPEKREPKLFVRAISAPPGLPWDQARAAALEARVGAPLPLDEVVHVVRRLESWAPGKPGRFAAVYVRAAEVGDRLVASAHVDDQTLELVFLSRAERERRRGALALVAGASVATMALLVLSAALALGARTQAAVRLAAVEHRVEGRLRSVAAQDRLRDETRALNAENLDGRRLSDFLGDLAWVSSAKAPHARIQALHWDHGYLAVEVRGDGPPFEPGAGGLERSEKPVAPGVWLWGLQR